MTALVRVARVFVPECRSLWGLFFTGLLFFIPFSSFGVLALGRWFPTFVETHLNPVYIGAKNNVRMLGAVVSIGLIINVIIIAGGLLILGGIYGLIGVMRAYHTVRALFLE